MRRYMLKFKLFKHTLSGEELEGIRLAHVLGAEFGLPRTLLAKAGGVVMAGDFRLPLHKHCDSVT